MVKFKSNLFVLFILSVILLGIYYISLQINLSFFVTLAFFVLFIGVLSLVAYFIFYLILKIFYPIIKLEEIEKKEYLSKGKNLKSKEFIRYEKNNPLFVGSTYFGSGLFFITSKTFYKTVNFLITRKEIVFDLKPILVLPISKVESVTLSKITNSLSLKSVYGKKYIFKYWKFFPWDNIIYDAPVSLFIINDDVKRNNKKIFNIINDLISKRKN